MGYNKRPSSFKPLPGSSIKGAGALAPGVYKGFFEAPQRGGTGAWSFVSVPAGFHIMWGEDQAQEAAAQVPPGAEATVTIGLSMGTIIARTDGGRLYLADAQTKEALTAQHTELEPLFVEAGEKKLRMASPVICQIDVGGKNVWKRDISN